MTHQGAWLTAFHRDTIYENPEMLGACQREPLQDLSTIEGRYDGLVDWVELVAASISLSDIY